MCRGKKKKCSPMHWCNKLQQFIAQKFHSGHNCVIKRNTDSMGKQLEFSGEGLGKASFLSSPSNSNRRLSVQFPGS